MADQDSPEIIFERKPTRLEKNLRMGCGSVRGLVLGLSIGVRWYPTQTGLALAVIACVIGCAWCALKFGDRFWVNWSRWWW